MRIELLKKEVEKRMNVSNLFSKSRKDKYLRARAIFYALLRESGMTLMSIADHCNYKAHNTIIHGLNYFDYLYETDSGIQSIYDSLTVELKPNIELRKEIITNLDYLTTDSLKALNELLKTLKYNK